MALPDTTEELKSHLNAILEDPKKTSLRVRLVQTFTAQLVDVEALAPALFPTLVPLIASVLQVVEQDPTVLTILLQRLLNHVPFNQVLGLADTNTFLALLSSPVPPIQLLGLFLLQKAAVSTGDVAIVATWNEVCKELVNTTLCANDTAVHKEANRVLFALLLTDLPSSGTGEVESSISKERIGGGSGLFWRRIFSDRDIYHLILHVCSWKGSSDSFSKKTNAQSRLLALIPNVAKMDWNTVTANTFPDLVQQYTIGNTKATSLLDFATYGMVKLQNDVMMGMLHLDYLSDLLTSTAPSEKALEYLSSERVGKHQEAIGLFLHTRIFTKDEMDIGLLESRAGKYCSTYSQLFPKHLLSRTSSSTILPRDVKDQFPEFSEGEYSKLRMTYNTDGTRLVDLFITHIAQALDRGRKSRTAYEPPITSLHLLTSLPPEVLISPPTFPLDSGRISRTEYEQWRTSNSIITLVPLSPPLTEYISTIGTLFASSQQLYSIYSTFIFNQEHPQPPSQTIYTPATTIPLPSAPTAQTLWTKILTIASSPALTDSCLAALSLIQAVASTTRWNGILEILKQPRLMEFIIRPQERHTARRVADQESIEFRCGMVKYDIVRLLARVVREVGGDAEGNLVGVGVEEGEGEGEKRILVGRWAKTVMQRVRMGVWEVEQQPVVGTMEE